MGKGKNSLKNNTHSKDYLINFVVELMSKNIPKSEILELLVRETGKSQRMCYDYYNLALARLRDDYQENVADIRHKKIKSLERDASKLISKFEETGNAQFYKMYLEVQFHLDKYYPNKLEPELDNKDIQIQIEYKKPE